jgi:hypothetical protein
VSDGLVKSFSTYSRRHVLDDRSPNLIVFEGVLILPPDDGEYPANDNINLMDMPV